MGTVSVTDLFEAAKLEAGQWQFQDLELSLVPDFTTLLNEWVLSELRRMAFVVQVSTLEINTSYTFTTSPVPDRVVSVVPVGHLHTGTTLESILLWIQQGQGNYYVDAFGTTTPVAPWRYEPPTLYVAVPGRYSVEALYMPYLDLNTLEVKNYNTEYKDLLVRGAGAVLKVALGRARRVARPQDFPFEVDADQLIQEGREDLDRLREELSTNRGTAQWWIALGS